MTDTNQKSQLNDIPITTTHSRDQLTDKQQIVYEDHRKKLATWALALGKDPRQAQGYAHETANSLWKSLKASRETRTLYPAGP